MKLQLRRDFEAQHLGSAGDREAAEGCGRGVVGMAFERGAELEKELIAERMFRRGH